MILYKYYIRSIYFKTSEKLHLISRSAVEQSLQTKISPIRELHYK